MIKVITGIRRCGKSYLLFDIYHQYLNSIGVDDGHIIELALDDDENIKYRNPIQLGEYIRSLLVDKEKMYYTFLDEIPLMLVWLSIITRMGKEKAERPIWKLTLLQPKAVVNIMFNPLLLLEKKRNDCRRLDRMQEFRILLRRSLW